MASLSRRLSRPVWWLLPIVILFFAEAAPQIAGKNLVFYLVIFVLGFVTVCDRSFMESVERYRIPALAAGLGLSLFTVLTYGFRDSLADPSFALSGLVILNMAGVWLSMMGFLGLGKRYLNRTSRAQRYLAQASYPVYIIHQTLIVVIAFYLVGSGLPEPVQWVLLLLTVVLGTFTLYEIVRRVNVLRFLLGMRMKPRAATSEAASAAPAAPVASAALVVAAALAAPVGAVGSDARLTEGTATH